jgi:EmrB/QacA subfamily drug resistance transporter
MALTQTMPGQSKTNKAGVMLIIALFLAMIFLDETSVGVVLTSIQKEFLMTNIMASWVMNAYLLSLSAFILLFARLSDFFGIKRILIMGLILFALASLGCALSGSGGMLILMRALQGLGASMGLATYLLVLNQEIPLENRGKVLGASAAIGAIFLSAGPLIGGFFTAYLSWRYIFWVNLPVCFLCGLVAYRVVHQHKNNHEAFQLDWLGLLLFIAVVVCLVLPFMQAPQIGWGNPVTIGLLVAAVIGLIAFCMVEAQRKNPLLDLSLFKNSQYSASIAILFLTYACSMSLVFWAIWLEQVMGFSAMCTGVALLPAVIPYVFTSKLSGKMLDKTSPRKPLLIGTTLFFMGFVWIAIFAHQLNYTLFLIGLIFFGAGWGMIRPCGILAAMNSVPKKHKSMASGVLNTLRQLGATFGFAALFATIMTTYHYFLKQVVQQNHLPFSIHQLGLFLVLKSVHPQYAYLWSMLKRGYTHAFTLGMLLACFFSFINGLLVFKCIE